MQLHSESEVMDVMSESLGIARENFNRDDHLYNTHGVDSLEGIEMVHVLEDRFGISISWDDIEQMCGSDDPGDATVGQWIDFVQSKLSQKKE